MHSFKILICAFALCLFTLAGNAAHAAELLDARDVVLSPDDAEYTVIDPYRVPAFSKGDVRQIGTVQNYAVTPVDTLHDIARHYGLGFIELRSANLGVDAWAPFPGTEMVLPTRHLLPRAKQEGLIVNLAEMRMYYFKDGEEPRTYPLGVGREGLETPVGVTSIMRKAKDPNWHPTPRMREENPDLPWRVTPGPQNPLGTRALYLGWPAFLVHGTNKPWGIGRRISSGCIRMYPEHIEAIYGDIPVGTRVEVIHQPVKLAVIDDTLWMEVAPEDPYIADIELNGTFQAPPRTIPQSLRSWLEREVKDTDIALDWDAVNIAYNARSGLPHAVGIKGKALPETSKASRPSSRSAGGYSFN